MKIEILNGRVLDPGLELDAEHDILIDDGKIKEIAKPGGLSEAGDERHDAKGRWVLPGLTDLRTHVREPGQEYKEDIETASMAAVAGGFTSILATPNTGIAMDTREMIEHVLRRGRDVGLCQVEAATSITQGLGGTVLTEVATTQRAGAKIISEGYHTVANAQLMRSALEYATDFGLTVMTYAQDHELSSGGHMHEGGVATILGLKGIPKAAEVAIVSRDIALAELTGAKLHLSQISCAESVNLLKRAQEKGLSITADVSPNHLVFSDQDLSQFDTNLKVEPPIRDSDDREALLKGVVDGTLTAIASGHAPQTILEKDVTFGAAATGATGLQTALSAALTVAKREQLPEAAFIRALTRGPAMVLNGSYHGIAIGAPANLVVFNPATQWTVDTSHLVSKSKNSPFIDHSLSGQVEKTFFDGRLVYCL